MTGPFDDLTEAQRRQIRDAHATRKEAEAVRATPKPCRECGCDPNDAWGCECTNPDCPCSEPEAGED